jgi:hypothetical protein
MTTRRLNRADLIAIVGGDQRALRAFERLLNQVQANISGPSVLAINYNSDGTIATPTPIAVRFRLIPDNGGAFTSGVSWGFTVLSGTFDGAAPTIGGTGTGTLFINSGLASPEVTLGITARIDGVGYPPFTLMLTRSIAPPDGGGGGVTASDSTSTFNAIILGTFAPVARDLAITLPTAATSATLTAGALELRLSNELPQGDVTVEMKWQRETAPSVWSDVGAAATSSPSPFVLDEGGGLFFAEPGSITCNRTETGMTGGTQQKFRLVARVSAGAVRDVSVTGTVAIAS